MVGPCDSRPDLDPREDDERGTTSSSSRRRPGPPAPKDRVMDVLRMLPDFGRRSEGPRPGDVRPVCSDEVPDES